MAGISINLAGNFGALDELRNRAQRTAGSVKAAFGSDLSKAMFAGVAAASAAAFAGVVAAMKSAIDAGGELNDMMARTGAEGKGLVVMQRAFLNAGMAASQVPAVLNKMQKALAGVNDEGQPTNEAFEKLGLSIYELLTLDPVEAFKQTAAAISSIEDPAQRTTLAMDLFGKSGGEMLAVLTDSAAFSGAEEQVGSLGATLAAHAGDLDAVGDAFGALDTKIQQLGVEVAVALLPQLTAFGTWLNETDFSAVGGAIGILIEKVAAFAEKLAELSQYIPLIAIMNKVSELTGGGQLTDEDREKAKAMAAGWAANDPEHGKSRIDTAAAKEEKIAKLRATADAAKGAKDEEKAAAAAEKKAEAERDATAQKEKSRAAALEDYNMESRILSARLVGDKVRLAALEREKAIREEIKRLESAGFTKDEAARPAEAKVDAEKKADDKEAAYQQAQEAKTALQEKLAGKVNQTRDKLENLQYQTSVGSISSMQRVGGGGGAVASGLDYQRQVADLQRESNGYLRELIEVSRQPVE